MVAVSLPAAGRDGSPAAWLSSLWLIAWVKLVLLTGPEWVWDKLGTAEFFRAAWPNPGEDAACSTKL